MKYWWPVLIIVVAVSCTDTGRLESPRRMEIPPGAVTHVVVVWLKTPGDESAREKLIAASKGFEEIPGVLRVTAGRSLASTRPVVDASFDVAVMILFRDRQAMNDYELHPLHKQAVEEILKPLAGKVLIYDSVD